MPDPDLMLILSFVTVIVLIVSLASIIVKALDRKKTAPSTSLPGVEDRLGRIEQAVEAIAIEVERVSEGQRFTTRLLTDRAREPQQR